RWPFVLLPRVRRRLTCPRLPYATLFRSPAVPVAAGLAGRASVGRGYGSGAPSRPSGGAYVFIGSALQRHEPHGLATAAAQAQLQHVAGADFAGFVDEGEGLVLPVRAVAVAIDLGAIAAAGIEEGQWRLQHARGVVADRAEEPLPAAARLACQHRVLADRTVDHAAFLPVHRHVADELQRLRLPGVVLGQVGD